MELSGQNLCCERGGRQVFAGLNFSVKSGSMLILRGPNGAGKTSLLRMIAGLNEPGEGRLSLSGLSDDLGIARNSHFIAHQDAFKPALTVEENLQFWADFFDGGDIDAALEAFSLERLAGFSAGLLSAGQKRRLALGRLAMIKRPVWLLDEPTVGLDVTSVGQLQKLMKAHLKDNGIIIATTHIDLGMKDAKVFDFAEQGVVR
jgi:heme exporter protein A